MSDGGQSSGASAGTGAGTGTSTAGDGQQGTGGAGQQGSQGQQGTQANAGQTGTGTGQQQGAGTGAGQEFDPKTLDAAAQAYLAKQIADADARARTTSKENAAKQARTDVLAEIGKALGLTAAPADPAAAAQQVSALQTSNRELTIEVAILRGASTHGGNPQAIADSRAFMAKANALDPTADNFTEQLEGLIKAHIEANPSAKAAGAPPAPAASQAGGGQFGAGNGQQQQGSGEQSIDDLRGVLFPKKTA